MRVGCCKQGPATRVDSVLSTDQRVVRASPAEALHTQPSMQGLYDSMRCLRTMAHLEWCYTRCSWLQVTPATSRAGVGAFLTKREEAVHRKEAVQFRQVGERDECICTWARLRSAVRAKTQWLGRAHRERWERQRHHVLWRAAQAPAGPGRACEACNAAVAGAPEENN